MNLERMEQQCISYLTQATNPIVPVNNLLRHLWRDEEFADLTRQDLLSYLGKHEMVTVVDAGLDKDPERARDLIEAGLGSGPRVILKSRMPTKAEMSDLIGQQLATMTEALEKAFLEAAREGDTDACLKIQEVLDRTQHLREEIHKVL